VDEDLVCYLQRVSFRNASSGVLFFAIFLSVFSIGAHLVGAFSYEKIGESCAS
jgi:hypothetical protein